MISSLEHFRLGKIDSRLVGEFGIKIRIANCGAFVYDRSGTVRNCAFRSFPAGRRKRKVPALCFLFPFSILSTGRERDKQKRCDEVGRLDISPGRPGRLKVAEYSSRAERALAR